VTPLAHAASGHERNTDCGTYGALTASNRYRMVTVKGPYMNAERSERFELRLTQTEAKMLRTMATDAGMSAADFLRRLLQQAWGEQRRRYDAQRLETLAMVSLNEMASRGGISLAVVFTAGPDVPWEPSKKRDGGPQPKTTSTLEVPMLGSIVTQGFANGLSSEQRAVVEARFPGRTTTWLTRAR